MTPRCGDLLVTPMKKLITERLRLEPVCEGHAPEMFPVLADPALYTCLAAKPPKSVEELAERYARQAQGGSPDGKQRWLNWILRSVNDGDACAGFVQATLHTETTGDLGYILGTAFWGRGLALEACEAAITALLALPGLTTLFATVDRRNVRSLALLARLGFQRVERDTYPHGVADESDDVYRLERPA